MELIERKIGETFEFEGKKIEVKAASSDECDGCLFNGKCTLESKKLSGECDRDWRSDGKNVIFVEVQEQEKDEQPKKLNLCEILKYCPQGETFWSPMLDYVKLHDVRQNAEMVSVILKSGATWDINADGTITVGGDTSPEIMLYPNKEQRDWTKVKYEPKKELPRTWEEFCQQNEMRKGDCFISEDSEPVVIEKGIGMRDENFDRNILPSEEAAKAHLALMQLHQLRDAWREGWLPDWKDYNQKKYVIYNPEGEFTIGYFTITRRFLAFQDEKRADEFKNCFIDLIKQAGDLI